MKRVLFVEDEAIMRAAFRKMIDWDSSGYELAAVLSNGAEALEYIGKNHVDILITDLIMPVMGGIELIETLRSTSFVGIILVLSNYADFELVRAALTGGASDYMLKINIDGETLKKQLDNAARLLDAAGAPAAEAPDGIPAEYRRVKKEVRDILLFIHSNYTDKITLDDVVSTANLNKSHLCRMFKRETGKSILSYINELRVKKAAELIDEGESNVQNLAALVGINDQFHFSRLFKKHHGVSPREYYKRTEQQREKSRYVERNVF